MNEDISNAIQNSSSIDNVTRQVLLTLQWNVVPNSDSKIKSYATIYGHALYLVKNGILQALPIY